MRGWLAVILVSGCGGHPGGLVVTWSFAGIEEGYDHPNRVDVYVDGQPLAQSTVTPQSERNAVSVVVPDGAHTVRVVNSALYDGVWEEHTVANDYSIDCVWEGTVSPRDKKLDLVFDLDQGTRVR
ncbi:MAG: hypothetical protein ABMB14_34365 [Myxococcota bacterium]